MVCIAQKKRCSYFARYAQIGESAGQECKAALQETNKLLEVGLKVNRKAVKALFNATGLHVDADFLYLTADAAVMAVRI